ncbi:hypothetical protein MCOR28_007475 [Pyricularia oryzae]|nr:hypothetical protein MCOR19_000146 [Pyricularia oryzae]KAI6272633.1 hypothetical protein MCOR26_007265 [Pyricularia oryzae]KAI6322557.1 hypothetical protein MCOR34_002188 [Pyricularia oryzae]KAI6339115.1 hypothetical protein MCOR28_007475 [Pyricularia oryzae]KAI6469691.1 hypothetical protein MCOR17_003760 [Pyricularia oryzae]
MSWRQKRASSQPTEESPRTRTAPSPSSLLCTFCASIVSLGNHPSTWLPEVAARMARGSSSGTAFPKIAEPEPSLLDPIVPTDAA